MTTARQIQANQINSLRSTGPSEEGKAASRRNALKHGLAGEGIVLPDEEEQAVADRIEQWGATLRPEGPYKVWLAGVVALESVRLDRCHKQEAALRTRLALRAIGCWAEDRRLAAELLAVGMRRRPASVGRQLRRTAQGCELLIERWGMLAQIAAVQGGWDDPQRALALDLLGVPTELRSVPTCLDAAPGRDPVAVLRAVAGAEVARLEALKAEVLDALDDSEQADAQVGLGLDTDRDLKCLLRYESGCMRRLRWALDQIEADRAAVEEPARPVEGAPKTPAPKAAPAPSLAPVAVAAAVAVHVPTTMLMGAGFRDAVAVVPEPGNRRARRARRRLELRG